MTKYVCIAPFSPRIAALCRNMRRHPRGLSMSSTLIQQQSILTTRFLQVSTYIWQLSYVPMLYALYNTCMHAWVSYLCIHQWHFIIYKSSPCLIMKWLQRYDLELILYFDTLKIFRRINCNISLKFEFDSGVRCFRFFYYVRLVSIIHVHHGQKWWTIHRGCKTCRLKYTVDYCR